MENNEMNVNIGEMTDDQLKALLAKALIANGKREEEKLKKLNSHEGTLGDMLEQAKKEGWEDWLLSQSMSVVRSDDTSKRRRANGTEMGNVKDAVIKVLKAKKAMTYKEICGELPECSEKTIKSVLTKYRDEKWTAEKSGPGHRDPLVYTIIEEEEDEEEDEEDEDIEEEEDKEEAKKTKKTKKTKKKSKEEEEEV